MMPAFYQTFFAHLLTARQSLFLHLLVATLQTHKQLALGKLSQALPLPITADSRKRALQRFLTLDKLNIFEAWFPLVLYLVLTHFSKTTTLKLAIDRTDWWHYNVLTVALVWHRHALPLNWTLLDHPGNSNLEDQQLLLSPVLSLLSAYRVVVLGDREFCSVKLANWLRSRKAGFCLRLKISEYIRQQGADFRSLKSLELQPGMSMFLGGVRVTKNRKNKGFEPFNIACIWKRKIRNMQPGEGWYILTDRPKLHEALELYADRWGIEVWHKDVKSCGYHLEEVRVSQERMMRVLLLASIAWSAAMLNGLQLERIGVDKYTGRVQEKQRRLRRHSPFRVGQYAWHWAQAVLGLGDWLDNLIDTCRNKARDYRRGLRAARLMLSVT
ncbi:IS4 family transposase [Gloeobacter morelensis]|uniref:IS4 family transposase n=3 Tax=Gloeobacter morelensis MG652769 TaxID=2781736 RepID=A0ABY3PIH9_9CYAN|nr:IS4 family transposase [Gloeobacter morelensis]UFP92621.1 IS4 family transposase [Gloeobacter morelensis MG652769]UFP92700.1 IS4 family transposase [Gloeobacter morelensis MG652769]UFP92754.1 IS4 family transposase [Gloeobacter morelensis MG652769]UFP92916.1 IS4 family transposase [Gloeobacter morelensis MG652769]UFP93107.1 IS4 family transposase [Gloeobacter morelensis MG652769]